MHTADDSNVVRNTFSTAPAWAPKPHTAKIQPLRFRQPASAMVLALAAGLFSMAAAAPNPVFAPKLTLSCLNLHFNADNSADLTCKLQHTASGTSPAIRNVILNVAAPNGAFSQYKGDDLLVGATDTISLHFLPNSYRNFNQYWAVGTADDAIFGNIISQFIPGRTGQNVFSNSLLLRDPQQPPQFDMLAICSMEAFFPPGFKFSGCRRYQYPRRRYPSSGPRSE
jgi:hypothetical protein